jgi:hypothetical protein
VRGPRNKGSTGKIRDQHYELKMKQVHTSWIGLRPASRRRFGRDRRQGWCVQGLLENRPHRQSDDVEKIKEKQTRGGKVFRIRLNSCRMNHELAPEHCAGADSMDRLNRGEHRNPVRKLGTWKTKNEATKEIARSNPNTRWKTDRTEKI